MTEQILQKPAKCVVTGQNGIYSVEWPVINVSAKVSHFHETRDFELKATVVFESTRPGSDTHLKGGRLNLSSLQTRNQFQKALESRDSSVDWDAVLEQLCSKVTSLYREGSPVIMIDDREEFANEDQSRWMIEPLIQTQNPTLIYGPGGAGKSMFAIYLSVLVGTGTSHGGLNVEPGNVLYLDWETGPDEIWSRVKMVMRGLNLAEGKSNVFYKQMSQGLDQAKERIKEICLEKSISLVVVDSVGPACTGPSEESETINRLFNTLRELTEVQQVSSLCIDHVNKDGHLFGSIYKENRARMMFQVKKHQEKDEDTLHMGLFHQKANNGKKQRDIGFELSFGDSSVVFTRKDVRDTPLEVHMTWADRVANIIRINHKTRPQGLAAMEIAEELQNGGDEKELNKIRNQVSVLFNNDKNSMRPRFVQVRDRNGSLTGKWGLAAMPNQVEEERSWQRQTKLRETVKEIVKEEEELVL